VPILPFIQRSSTQIGTCAIWGASGACELATTSTSLSKMLLIQGA